MFCSYNTIAYSHKPFFNFLKSPLGILSTIHTLGTYYIILILLDFHPLSFTNDSTWKLFNSNSVVEVFRSGPTYFTVYPSMGKFGIQNAHHSRMQCTSCCKFVYPCRYLVYVSKFQREASEAIDFDPPGIPPSRTQEKRECETYISRSVKVRLVQFTKLW